MATTNNMVTEAKDWSKQQVIIGLVAYNMHLTGRNLIVNFLSKKMFK